MQALPRSDEKDQWRASSAYWAGQYLEMEKSYVWESISMEDVGAFRVFVGHRYLQRRWRLVTQRMWELLRA